MPETGAVNDKSADVIKLSDHAVLLSYTFPPKIAPTPPMPPTAVTSVDAFVIAPEAGEAMSEKAGTLEASYKIGSVTWYDYKGNILNAGDTFENGRQYAVTLHLNAADGYEFNNPAGMINNKNAIIMGLTPTELDISYVFTVAGEIVTPSPSPTSASDPSTTSTPSGSPIPSGSPTPTGSPSPGGLPSPTGSPSPGGSPIPSGSPTPTGSPSSTGSPTPSSSPSPTPTVRPASGGGRGGGSSSYRVTFNANNARIRHNR